MIRRPAFFALLVGLPLLGGCNPTCSNVCDKLVACDEVETPRMSSEVCEQSCETQEDLYFSWDDTQLQEAFTEYKQCVRSSSCEAIAEGVCYDEDIYLF